MRLKDRVAIVTGAASGIGRASAGLFAEEGARVLAVDRPGTQLAAAQAGRQGVAVLEKSVSDADAPAAIVGRAMELFGRLDILLTTPGSRAGRWPTSRPTRTGKRCWM